MNTIKSIKTNNNDMSCSRAKQFLATPIMGTDGKLLNGEFKFKFENEEEDTICRFVDGNIYNDDGNIVDRRPALEYGFGGTEFWSKVFPEGYPAVVKNFGYYEEDWHNGTIQEIRSEVELEDIE